MRSSLELLLEFGTGGFVAHRSDDLMSSPQGRMGDGASETAAHARDEESF